MQTLLVTDDLESWAFLCDLAQVVSASDYIGDLSYHQTPSLRIINLCKSYHHQSIGYYVSLLATARDHRVIPSVINIQDILNPSLTRHLSQDLEDEIQKSLGDLKDDTFILSLYFGQNVAKKYANLARKLHALFPLPLMRFTFERKKNWQVKKLQPLSYLDVPLHHVDFMKEAATSYFSKKRFHQYKKKQRYHDVAILVDPHEHTPPSNQKALELFIQTGEELGLNVDLIDKNDIKILAEYDALFIRATTSVDHYTYRFARRALQENLVVVDDPQSIVKCSNKVYLAELLRSHQILTPDTVFLSKYDAKLPELHYPCVLKKPDSAFSQGVIKIDCEKTLEKSVTQFFKSSDLILIQPFIPTDFDWRIGIFDHKPIFACRYFMAKNHWQIVNWKAEKAEQEGSSECVPLEAVPEGVLKTALKATKLIGSSLYGVDIKTHGDKHYVIEVNDNPNIDFGVEDEYLGISLYQKIMDIFLQRIRRKHGYV